MHTYSMELQLASAGGRLGPGSPEALFYVTALSNFVRGYDKYARAYDKARIPESTFPDRFYLLRRDELHIGVTKAAPLLAKAGLPGDRLIALQTHASADELQANLRTGLGRSVGRGHIALDAVHLVDGRELIQRSAEEICALSYDLHREKLVAFDALVPRTVSFLPVARACPARCSFCFSKASVSAELAPQPLDWDRVAEVLRAARARGAGRAVITGGGEPTLTSETDLERLIRDSSALLPKVVLISNGFRWGPLGDAARAEALHRLSAAGLSVLALSRHHWEPARNERIMGLAIDGEAIGRTLTSLAAGPKLRWICVLQQGGVEDHSSLAAYLDWAVGTGAREICFKELYVSTTVESEFHDRAANDWSAQHQVPLRLVLDLAAEQQWPVVERLPWGAPIFEGSWRGQPLRVAAYTEPSLLWERTHGLCRSWNLMADGRCLASLEDRHSEVLPRGLRSLSTLS